MKKCAGDGGGDAAWTLHPVGSSDKFVPLMGPDGNVYALADPSSNAIVERYRYLDFGQSLIDPIHDSGTWSLIDPGFPGPVSFSSGHTKVFAAEVSPSWQGKVIRADVFGASREFAVVNVEFSERDETYFAELAGDATAIIADGSYFEVLASSTLKVDSIGSSGTGSAAKTTITFTSSPGATDTLVGRYVVLNVAQPHAVVPIIANHGPNATITVKGDVTDLLAPDDFSRLHAAESAVGNLRLCGQATVEYHGGTIEIGTTVYVLPNQLFSPSGGGFDMLAGQALNSPRAPMWLQPHHQYANPAHNPMLWSPTDWNNPTSWLSPAAHEAMVRRRLNGEDAEFNHWFNRLSTYFQPQVLKQQVITRIVGSPTPVTNTGPNGKNTATRMRLKRLRKAMRFALITPRKTRWSARNSARKSPLRDAE